MMLFGGVACACPVDRGVYRLGGAELRFVQRFRAYDGEQPLAKLTVGRDVVYDLMGGPSADMEKEVLFDPEKLGPATEMIRVPQGSGRPKALRLPGFAAFLGLPDKPWRRVKCER